MSILAETSLALEKLDARHSGHRLFRYRVRIIGPLGSRYARFYQVRSQCWEVWGPSNEREIHTTLWRDEHKENRNTHWCWHFDQKQNDVYIYLASDEEASYFKLKYM